MSKFAETLDALLFDHNFKPNTFAKAIGVPSSTITRLLKCERAPSLKTLVKIAEHFKVTTDFLLGFENENSSTAFNLCPQIGERIKQLTEQNGYTGYRFCKECKLSEPRFYDWINGTHEPSVDNVIKIAKFLNCSVDFLLGREI
ncbi:MAG: transcriptional regulator [Clostridia bacterium]|nr:transcriptional regulator [Clostridia bacterium]